VELILQIAILIIKNCKFYCVSSIVHNKKIVWLSLFCKLICEYGYVLMYNFFHFFL
jgi:hypothetical protein